MEPTMKKKELKVVMNGGRVFFIMSLWFVCFFKQHAYFH